MTKIFFISPVRQVTENIKENCERYVKKLEKEGYQVHWPIRNTDQNDVIGINICDTNLKKIMEADEIHVWYHKTSTGIHFDLGAVYLLVRIIGCRKKVVFANKNEFGTEFLIENGEFINKGGKSFLNVLDYLDKTTGITLENLKNALEKAWSKETSAEQEKWTPDNPAWGQCAVTALVVQDYFGGELIKGKAEIGDELISHYWNKLPNIGDIDLTKEQFPAGTKISMKLIRERSYLINHESTRKRYELLKSSLKKILQREAKNDYQRIAENS